MTLADGVADIALAEHLQNSDGVARVIEIFDRVRHAVLNVKVDVYEIVVVGDHQRLIVHRLVAPRPVAEREALNGLGHQAHALHERNFHL